MPQFKSSIIRKKRESERNGEKKGHINEFSFDDYDDWQMRNTAT